MVTWFKIRRQRRPVEAYVTHIVGSRGLSRRPFSPCAVQASGSPRFTKAQPSCRTAVKLLRSEGKCCLQLDLCFAHRFFLEKANSPHCSCALELVDRARWLLRHCSARANTVKET